MPSHHSMLRSLCFTLIVLALTVGLSAASAAVTGQGSWQPAPTLVSPTLVPVSDAGVFDALPATSGTARIVETGTVRVGILYNEPPFGELNVRGEVSGFDADLARAMAEAWGVEIAFVQVTRQTAIDMLLADEVDLLAAALVQDRTLDSRVEFTQPYYPGEQMMMVREGDGATVLAHMEGRKIGVVIGTRGERAAADWLARSGVSASIETYLTLDQALAALKTQTVDGVVENRIRLTRAVTEQGVFRFVDQPVGYEPYAFAVRRQDVHLRNLINRTLQYLIVEGSVDEFHRAHFDGVNYPATDVTLWRSIGDDAPTLAQVGTDVPLPAQYVVPRLQQGGALRVAGFADLPDEADESARRLNDANRAVIEALALRWGVPVDILPNSRDNALDLIAAGEADIAVGIEPDWDWASRVDFTTHYLMHGERLMVKADSDVGGFAQLRSRWIGIFASEPDADDRVRAHAEAERARVDVFLLTNEADAAFGMLVQNNYDAVYGDSIKLVPHLLANPDALRLTVNDQNGGWYTRSYLAFAVPRNDIDLRLLVNYTLQALSQDGTLTRALEPVMPPGEVLVLRRQPGNGDTFGFELGG